ncbi:MAG: hypothetical protein IKX31_07520 [Muribaculaceae bacterium]|nr:hypothetical protein [Muribaculaceae bacterium]
MKVIKNIIAASLLVLACITTANAQSSTSPYSKLGYGILSDNATGIQRSMGGVGYAMQNGRQINVMNPASYSQVDSLTFLLDMGMDLTNCWSKEDGKKGYSFGGGLDYITSEFRLAKNLGAAIGVVPFSSVGYIFGGEIDNGNETRAGSGGMSELFAGVGWQPFKGFSIGANFSYLFGTTTNTTEIYSSSTTRFTRNMEVRDWNMRAGLQYGFNISRKSRVVLGATYSPKKSLHGTAWATMADVDQDTKQDTVVDMKMKGNYELPTTIGAGVSYTYDNRLNIEVDYTYQQWSKAKYTPINYFEVADTKWNDRWKVAAGMSYTPNPRGNYLNRMTYRVGAFYNNDYMNVYGNNVKDYGVGLGFSFPALSGKTLVNLGLEWKHRYTTPKDLISENYLNITLSVNFNEMWFWKNKIR